MIKNVRRRLARWRSTPAGWIWPLATVAAIATAALAFRWWRALPPLNWTSAFSSSTSPSSQGTNIACPETLLPIAVLPTSSTSPSSKVVLLAPPSASLSRRPATSATSEAASAIPWAGTLLTTKRPSSSASGILNPSFRNTMPTLFSRGGSGAWHVWHATPYRRPYAGMASAVAAMIRYEAMLKEMEALSMRDD